MPIKSIRRIAVIIPILTGFASGIPAKRDSPSGYCGVQANECYANDGTGTLGYCGNSWQVSDPGLVMGCVYPLSVSNPYASPLVLSYKNFTIEWKENDASATSPVTFRYGWSHIYWETNVTGTSFVFNAASIIDSFPTEVWPTVSAADAWYEAQNAVTSILSIRRSGGDVTDGSDMSMQFVLDTGGAGPYLDTQRALEYNKWRLGVGIGVGIGVPILLAITAFTAMFVTKKKMMRGLPGSRKKGEHTDAHSA
ncbi:hypothetical protein F5Y16DRAFT_424837 [Xylariaceae sp. FL0255]|nr:hypothetical protein F5Y16DRAFT_424837 [Xylariaceae sp. FL0255]